MTTTNMSSIWNLQHKTFKYKKRLLKTFLHNFWLPQQLNLESKSPQNGKHSKKNFELPPKDTSRLRVYSIGGVRQETFKTLV